MQQAYKCRIFILECLFVSCNTNWTFLGTQYNGWARRMSCTNRSTNVYFQYVTTSVLIVLYPLNIILHLKTVFLPKYIFINTETRKEEFHTLQKLSSTGTSSYRKQNMTCKLQSLNCVENLPPIFS